MPTDNTPGRIADAPDIPPPAATTATALLDSDGTYLGIGPVVLVSELQDGQVAIPADCDLPAGRYRWSAERQTFLPIAPANPLSDTPPPAALTAVALGFIATRKAGTSLPDETLRWLDAYLTSMDVRDTAVVRNVDVRAYLADRGLLK